MTQQLNKKEKEYRKIMKQGRQALRMSIIVFVFVFIIIVSLQGFFLYKLYEHNFTDILLNYVIYIGVLIIIWFIAIHRLWKYHKIGRILFFVAFGISVYALKDVYVFYEEQGEVFSSSMYFYGILALAIVRRFITMRYAFSFFTNRSIRSIWSVYDMFDDDLNELDVFEEDIVVKEDKVKDSPLMVKAKQHLRSRARTLGIVLYCFCIFTLVVTLLLKSQFPDMETELELIQYYLFMSSLYSMFIWSIPIVILYLYKPFSKITLIGAVSLECIHVILSISNYTNVIQSPMYTSMKWMFFIFEFLRVILLCMLALKVCRDPYIYAFWKNEERTRENRQPKKKIKS